MKQTESIRPYTPTDLRQRIAHFYDVPAERTLVRGLIRDGAPREYVNAYIEGNVLKFAMEFGAGVRKTSITYRIGDANRIYYPGFQRPAEAMFSASAARAGGGSREMAELSGWQRVEELLTQGGYGNVIQLSPPSADHRDHGDYGFLFWFERQGDEVVNHIFRYDEPKKGGLPASRLLAGAFGLSDDMADEKDFLRLPIPLIAGKGAIIDRLKAMGLETSQLAAEELEKRLRTDPIVRNALWQYKHALLQATPESFTNRGGWHGSPEELLSIIYERSYQLASAQGFLDRRYQAPLPPVFAGGSCPVTQSGMSNYSYADWLLRKPFECPKCGYISYVPVGNRCPGCKITKEQWAAENETEVCE